MGDLSTRTMLQYKVFKITKNFIYPQDKSLWFEKFVKIFLYRRYSAKMLLFEFMYAFSYFIGYFDRIFEDTDFKLYCRKEFLKF